MAKAENSIDYDLGGDFQALLAQNHSIAGSILDPELSESLSVEALRNRFVGQQCFLIGNGPSLNKTDLTCLKNKFTIGLNRIYLNYPAMGFQPTFYCCVNPNVARQFAAEIDALSSVKFITNRAVELFRNKKNTFFLDSISGVGFNKNLSVLSWHEGWTVTYCAMQVAFHLGFEEVVLVGVDHCFEEVGEPDKAVVAQGPDINHFHPDYFGRGTVWEYPNLDRSEQSYQIAREIFEAHNRRILDATVGGHLQVFPKVEYAAILGSDTCSGDSPFSKRNLEFALPNAPISEALTAKEEALIKRHPHANPLFLPTPKIPLEQRVVGLQKVINIYEQTYKKRYLPRLQALREIFKTRKRVFVIGNGPSLNKTDLNLLKDEVTFGVNGIFLKAKDSSFKPTFYVVEDHLVAEDRQAEIDDFTGPIKILPIYLAYCLEESEDTIFYNHVPRKSYPQGFDFSIDAEECTYTGCTVTFSCLQLAYYLGFEEIYLVGVDCSYDIPEDVKETKEYNIATLDMKSDDPNHFDPDYFGKGYRWHDPQVEKMREAYKEAHRVTQANSVNIYNATIGGKLEVFPRVDYHALFSHSALYPRILIIDITRLGERYATSQMKQSLFSRWPTANWMQVYAVGSDRYGIQVNASAEGEADQSPSARLAAAIEACRQFNPDAIYYRPVADKPHLHQLACEAIEQLNVPFVIHIVDDWPERLRRQDLPAYEAIDHSLRELLSKAYRCLSISEAMSTAFQERYDVEFAPIANCIEPEDWLAASEAASAPAQPDGDRPFTIRYLGSLADDMTLESVVDIAQAVAELQSSCSISIALEIYAGKIWLDRAAHRFEALPGVSIHEANFTDEVYRQKLVAADALLIAYNFDPSSIEYVRYSMANKLPECLAASVPVLAYGPAAVATIAYLERAGCARMVMEREPEQLRAALLELVNQPETCSPLAAAAREYAFKHHSADQVQTKFYGFLRGAALSRQRQASSNSQPALPAIQDALVGSFQRERRAHIDETKIVAELLAAEKPNAVMVDVGAHFGSALAPFAKQVWQVYAFEPDPDNRQQLLKKFETWENVVISESAVSDRFGETVALYASEESTGISALAPFRESHRPRCQVTTTTVANICAEHRLEHVDFLKIDTEGFDLMVLKGVPWEQVQPEVIECEFEDRKTVPLGYRFDDLAQYLVERGYTVLVSEWHPVVRYGIKHDWRRLVPYPCKLSSAEAWGNLLAFKQPPDLSKVVAIAEALIKTAPSQHKPQVSPLVMPTPVDRSPTASNSVEPSSNGHQTTQLPPTATTTDRSGDHDVVAPIEMGNGSHAKPVEARPAEAKPVKALNQTPATSASAFSKPKRFAFLVQRIVSYYRRWPFAVALLAVTCSGLSVIEDVPFRWALTGSSTGLLLLLLGHAATRSDRVIAQAQNAIEQAQNAAERAQRRADRAMKRGNAAVQQAQRAHQIGEEGRETSQQAVGASQRAMEISQRARDASASMSHLAEEVSHVRDASASALSLADEAKRFAHHSFGRAQRAEQIAELAIEQGNHTVETANHAAEQSSHAVEQSNHAAEQSSHAAETANHAAERSNHAVETANHAAEQSSHAAETANHAAERSNRAAERGNRATEATDRVERLLQTSNTNNSALFQPFNRRLVEEHFEALENFWLPAFGLQMDRRALGYLAHQVCLIEDACSGRLATTVQDMLVRILAARSVSSKRLSVLEIGSLFGINLGILHESCRGRFEDIHLTAVDPLDGYYGQSPFDKITQVPVTRSVFEHNMRCLDIPAQSVGLIQGLSTEDSVLSEVGQSQYNLLVIDGDHSYDGVKFDFEHYLSAVDIGGYIIFDDYSTEHWPEVTLFVDQEVKPNSCVEFVGARWRTAVFKVVKRDLK